MRFFRRFLAVGILLVFLPTPTSAGAQQIPSPSDVLGYELGERFTPVSGLTRYLYGLAEASDLVSVHPYGETIEGRPLLQVLFASRAHRARLEEILELNRELTDPDMPEARAEEIIEANPAVVYLSYGVHGNESSSSEAALWTAYDLARGAPELAGVLDSVIVVIDPALNPDGRDLYVNFYRRTRGLKPDPDRMALEHDAPGGRTNHYHFDLNRDWAWMTQRETRLRLATWDRWNPQVHADLHEMGSNSSYFFFPPAKPVNPLFPDHIREWADRIGRGNAAAFDEEGWLYYTAQGFDLFYPGYGDSWPSLLGGIGMTYEQAGGGGAGLATERSDGTLLTLRDRAMHHWTASKATIRTAAEGRGDLLRGFAEFHRNVDEGIPDFLLVPGEDPGQARALVRHLLGQGIEVQRAGSGFEADATAHPGFGSRGAFPEGTFLVRARQPRGRLAAALLLPDQELDAESSYDITAWSLAYAYGVETHTVDRSPNGGFETVSDMPSTPGGSGLVGGAYGYLMTPGFDRMPGLVQFLEAGGRAYVQPDTFRMGGTLYPDGTFLLPRGRNDNLASKIRDAGLAPFVTPVSTGLTDTGLDLGTGSAGFVTLPKVGLLGGDGVSSRSYGANWFFLEQVLALPYTAISLNALTSPDLADYDVLVFPEGASRLNDGQSEAVEDWVRSGGTLVAVGSSARGLGRSLAGMEMREAEEDELDRDERLSRALRTREEIRSDRWEQAVPGSILKVKLSEGHPLTAGAGAGGLEEEMFVLSRGRSFEPDEGFTSVAYFPRGLEKTAGVIFDPSLRRLDRSTWLAEAGVGRGSLILFAEDPLFRMFWHSAFQLYANALLLGPAS